MALSAEKEREIIEEAQKRYKEVCDYEAKVRPLMVDDQYFDDGHQWSPDDEKRRKRERKPLITIPKTNQFSDRLKNEQRQNKPQIKVRPKGDADKKAAKFRKGLLRDIQYKSKAQLAYQTAFNHAVTMGRGHWLISTEYAAESGENAWFQDIVIDTLPFPLDVYLDWEHKEPDYSDCTYGLILESMNKDKFKEENPDVAVSHFDGSSRNSWLTSDSVTIARYYRQEIKKRTLLKVEQEGASRTLFKDEIKDEDYEKDVKPYITQKREVDFKTWHWYKMTSVEILDHHELPGVHSIPVATVVGKETVIEGEFNCKGIIRDLKDLGRMYNFWASQETELVSLAPRAPYIGAKGQFTGIPQWADANQTNYSYLEYNPVSAGGSMAPPPQRQSFAGVPAGIVNAKMAITEDMKAVAGMYNSSLGNREQVKSGIALQREEMTGDTSNFHFIDNYANAMNHTGRVINGMLPIYYPDGRVVSLLGDDDSNEEVTIGMLNKQGERVLLGDGEYDVIVEVGPSYATRRQEAAETTLELMSKVPMVSQLGGDLAVANMDLPMSDELAGRLKKGIKMQFGEDMVAPVVDDDNNQQKAMAMALQQAQQQGQMMQQQLQQLGQQLEKAQADKQAAAAGKIQVDMERIKIDQQRLQLDAQKIQGELALRQKELELDGMKAELDATTKDKINKDSLEVELIKAAQEDNRVTQIEHGKLRQSQQAINTGVFSAVTQRMSAEQAHMDHSDKTMLETESKKKDTDHATEKQKIAFDSSKKLAEIVKKFELEVKDTKKQIDQTPIDLQEIKDLVADIPKPAIKKKTIVKPAGEGKYTFETTGDNGVVTEGVVNKKGENYEIKSETETEEDAE